MRPATNVGFAWTVGFLIIGIVTLVAWHVASRVADPDLSGMAHIVAPLLFAVIGVVLGLAWKHVDGRSVEMRSARGGYDDTFLRSLGYLFDERLEIRLGGIYALDRLARTSDADQRPILEILAAFVRERSSNGRSEASEAVTHPADIQAALDVLGRGGWPRSAPPGRQLDLSGADLRGSNLGELHFEDVRFDRTQLDHANLRAACLDRAVLTHASLVGAYLRDAVLRGADFTDADLTQADLRGADLVGATGLAPERLASAITDASTRFEPSSHRENWLLPDWLAPFWRRKASDDDAPATSSVSVAQSTELNGQRNGRRHPALRMSAEVVLSNTAAQVLDAPTSESTPLVHQCPKCSSRDVDRDRFRGLGERLIIKVFNRRSYECLSCGARFYDRPLTDRP